MAVFSRAERISHISTSHRPGGQPGNTNALKHGLYARKFKHRRLADYNRAQANTGLDEETALLRLVILNLVESCLPAAGGPPDLAACNALEAALACLSHILKDQRLLALGDSDPAEVLAALFASANVSLPFTEIFSPSPAPPAPQPLRFSRSSFSLHFSSLHLSGVIIFNMATRFPDPHGMFLSPQV